MEKKKGIWGDNRTYHIVAEVFEDDNGDYYVVNIQDHYRKPLRGEYYPFGSRLTYPIQWGKKKGSLTLLEGLIDSDKKLIEQAQHRLEKLKKCKSKIETEWED
jgi:hypothetical protein